MRIIYSLRRYKNYQARLARLSCPSNQQSMIISDITFARLWNAVGRGVHIPFNSQVTGKFLNENSF